MTATIAEPKDVIKLLPDYDPYRDADGFYFNEEEANQHLEFFPAVLKHSEDHYGQPFVLSLWQQAIVANIYGWYSKDTGLRRYREAFIYVGKKNGKTATIAGLAVKELIMSRGFGTKVFSIAYNKDQASLVFDYAAGMVIQEPELASRLRVYGGPASPNTRNIWYDAKRSVYRPLTADAKAEDGKNPSLLIADEVHRYEDSELVEVLKKSMAARREWLVIYITTADFNRPSLCNRKLKKARDVCRARNRDPHFLPVVYENPKNADWKSEKVWERANPNLDITVTREFLRGECQSAIDDPSELNNFLRLHLNIVTDADVALIPSYLWEVCNGEFSSREDLEQFLAGRPCFAGLDLASREDISAFVLLFDVDGKLYSLPYFWVPRDSARKRERRAGVPYAQWIREGWIRTTTGETTDYDVIRRDINEINQQFNVQEIGYDPYDATQLTTQLEQDGFKIYSIQQSYLNLNGPTKELLRRLRGETFIHGDNPVLNWMAGNVTAEQDSHERIRPSKQKSAEKIDGIVSLVMAIARWQVHQEKSTFYGKGRGFERLFDE